MKLIGFSLSWRAQTTLLILLNYLSLTVSATAECPASTIFPKIFGFTPTQEATKYLYFKSNIICSDITPHFDFMLLGG
mgnify:CR=1 FL=1